ncbi:MAG TPA: hypothetical protein VL484_10450 [Vicinamibacterales bacterium]|nr:hypothetical protein [Vicinamibacterales bacterium]
MPSKNPRVDAHIDNAQAFARPILPHVRNGVRPKRVVRPAKPPLDVWIVEGRGRNWKYER